VPAPTLDDAVPGRSGAQSRQAVLAGHANDFL